VGQRVRRNIFSATGRDLEIRSGADGTPLYTTSGDIFTMHGHTQVSAASGAKIAYLWRWIFSWRNSYEVDSYSPVCATQAPAESKGPLGETLYSFARVSKRIFTLYTYWDVYLYQCDGSLLHAFRIQTRYWISLKYNYDIYEIIDPDTETLSTLPVGTVDQSYFLAMTAYYDAFFGPACDKSLFTTLQIILDMDHLRKEQQNDDRNSRHRSLIDRSSEQSAQFNTTIAWRH